MSHVCTCDDCAVAPYVDVCKYEQAGGQLAKDAVLIADALAVMTGERDEARAAVLALRDALTDLEERAGCGPTYHENWQMDTEPYEQFR